MKIRRAFIKSVSDESLSQTAIVQAHEATAKDVEIMQSYGFAYGAYQGQEVVTANDFGDTGAMGVVVSDKNFRPIIEDGEIMIYTKFNKETPQNIHLKKDGSIKATVDQNTIEMTKDKISLSVNGTTYIEIINGTIKLKSDEIMLDGHVTITNDLTVNNVESYVNHTHSGVDRGSSNTNEPNQ